jgi:hypothetical protein
MNSEQIQRKDAKTPSRKEMKGARLWSKTQPQRVGIAEMLRLVLRTQSRREASRLCAFAPLR